MVLTFDGIKIMQTNGNCIAEVKLPEENITIVGLGNAIRYLIPADINVFVIDENIPDFDNASPYSILSIANASSSGLMASCCGVVNRVSV